MTTLGLNIVKREGKYIIYRAVSGDLSHAFHLVPASSESGGLIGIGYAFATKKDAEKWLNKAKKYGFGSDKFRKMYDGYLKTHNFGYLPFRSAKPFLKEAYGEVADRYRKRLKELT
jgi:hypothetical protein